MLKIAVFLLGLFLISGYFAVEVARFRRNRMAGASHYPAIRLALRFVSLLLVLYLLAVFLSWMEFNGGFPANPELFLLGLATLLVVVMLDFVLVLRQIRREKNNRKNRFVAEMDELLRTSSKR